MRFQEYIKKHAILLLFLLIVCICLGIVLGCIYAPTIFYDQWIWKYYWGPVVSDAAGHTVTYHGVSAKEGYTLVSEITYGGILICALYGIYRLLKKLDICIDWRFCLALMPYILFGPVTRVLEDTEYFTEPTVFWFISPLIYLQIAGYTLCFVFLGWYLQKNAAQQPLRTVLDVGFVFLFINILYSILWTLDVRYGVFLIHPLFFVFSSFVAFLPILLYFYTKKPITVNTVVFSGGLLFLLPAVYLILLWVSGEPWSATAGIHVHVFLFIVFLVSVITAAVYGVAQIFRGKTWSEPYRKPLNLAMLVGHLVDGITTYVSIYDPLQMIALGYGEKHPASNFLMELWPPLFPVVKCFLILTVIYLFDVQYKDELQHHYTLVNLLKIGILILGFSPGVRGLVRVTLGV